MRAPNTLSRKLKAYSALAAVAVMAAPEADAQIIYTNVNPDITFSNSGSFDLDLNGDGQKDFTVSHFFSSNSHWTTSQNGVNGLPYGQVMALNSSSSYVNALQLNDSIPRVPQAWLDGVFLVGVNGNGFAGLSLNVKNDLYYGWVRLNFDLANNRLTIRDFAINSQPMAGLLAGEGACDSTVVPPTVSVLGDTLIAYATSKFQWVLDGDLVPLFNDSLQLYRPPQGVYAIRFQDSATGCFIQSRPVNYVKCDSIPSTIHSNSALAGCPQLWVNMAFNTLPAGFQFQWQKDGADIAGATNATYAAYINTSADYRLVLTYHGCVDTSNVIQYNVYAQPPPVVIQSGDTLISTPSAKYQWYNNNSFINGATNQFYLPKQLTWYRVEVTDSNNCRGTSNTILFDTCYYLIPLITIAADSLCPGTPTQLYATQGPGYHYGWQFLSPFGTDTFGVTVTQGGPYRVTISDTLGCSKTAYTFLYYLPPPSTSIIERNDTLFSTAGLVTYQWYNDTTLIPGATNSFYVPPQNGDYAIMVTNSIGCTAIGQTVRFPWCFKNFSVPLNYLGDSAAFCLGDSLRLNTLSASNYSYKWFRDTTALTGQEQYYTYADSTGAYKVQLTDTTRGCNYLSNPLQVHAYPVPLKPRIQFINGELVCDSTGQLLWYRNGVSLNDTTAHYIPGANAGYYHVEAVNSAGCSTSSDLFTYDPTGIISGTLPACYAWSQGKDVHLWLLQQDWMGGQIIIHNLLGEEVMNEKIETTRTTVHWNGAATLLLITVEKEGLRWSGKIAVE